KGNFFCEARDGSVVKVEIVSKYFSTWIKRKKNKVDKLTYIDLYSGQGIYDDGTESTPIKIIKHCLEDDVISNKIEMIFNDMNKYTSAKLRENINNLENIEKLKYNPLVFNQKIDSRSGNEFRLDDIGDSFAFIDPFGYKGLSKNLIDKLTEIWESECLFFFNYNEINRAIRNNKVEESINDLFGYECANTIRYKIDELYFESGISSQEQTAERETIIIDEFCSQFNQENKFVLPFRFESEARKCTSHYLIFVTKNYISFKIMKDIMNEISTYNIDGVGSFSYIPNYNNRYKNSLTYKYSISNIEDLENMIYELEHKGKEITVKKLCRKYVINTRFTEKNIKDALKSMESKQKITVQSKHAHRRKGTMSDNNIIIFKDCNRKTKFISKTYVDTEIDCLY
ncbi:MAG: three-Cys-motif partner protein TcmP, partial [Paraclostridium sp.]